MRSLLRYLINNFGFFLFIFLEIVSLFFVFSYNNYQKVKYLNSSNVIVGSIYSSFNSVVDYFELSRINKELAEENARLRSSLVANDTNNVFREYARSAFIPADSSIYRFISAKVINNSVNDPFNYITLNKGRKDGIQPDQGIISVNGVVGVVTNISDSYSMGLSLLNQRWGVSAKLKKSGFWGPLLWDGSDYQYANLMEIPFHVILQIGDTIVTSGYSTIFPEGIMIGTVWSFEKPAGENYYDLRVKLSTDFKSLSYVEVVENQKKEELEELENLIQENEGDN